MIYIRFFAKIDFKVSHNMDVRERARRIIKIFDKVYADAACSLEYKNPLQLLVSTMLAAQCTDERVNKVTKSLFEKYRSVYDFASADVYELQKEIKSTGFFRNKARNIINCCKMLIEEYNGQVPNNMKDLLRLPGVGRKTANLILGDIFGIPGIVVDTHAGRLARRMGFTKHEDPVKVEYDLMDIIPKNKWTSFCHQLVYHGRAVCRARKPDCIKCPVKELCDYGKSV